MKVKQLVDKIQKDWAVILICFVTAVFIYIFHQNTVTEKKSFVIPVEFVEKGGVTVTGKIADKVTVTVKSTTENVSQIHPNMFKAYVNLDSVTKAGSYSMPVMVDTDNTILAMDPLEISIKPETIKVHVDEKVSQYLRIVPEIIGEPAYGYEVTEISVDPKYVRAEGPSSILQADTIVKTKIIDIEDEKYSSDFEVDADKVNNLIKLDSDGPYKVSVKINYINITRTYENVPVRPLNLSESLEIVNELPVGSITLYGRQHTLENYKISDNALNVDLRGISQPGTYELPVNYVISSLYSLEAKSHDTVTVVIQNKTLEHLEPSVTENHSEHESVENIQKNEISSAENIDGDVSE